MIQSTTSGWSELARAATDQNSGKQDWHTPFNKYLSSPELAKEYVVKGVKHLHTVDYKIWYFHNYVQSVDLPTTLTLERRSKDGPARYCLLLLTRLLVDWPRQKTV